MKYLHNHYSNSNTTVDTLPRYGNSRLLSKIFLLGASPSWNDLILLLVRACVHTARNFQQGVGKHKWNTDDLSISTMKRYLAMGKSRDSTEYITDP